MHNFAFGKAILFLLSHLIIPCVAACKIQTAEILGDDVEAAGCPVFEAKLSFVAHVDGTIAEYTLKQHSQTVSRLQPLARLLT